MQVHSHPDKCDKCGSSRGACLTFRLGGDGDETSVGSLPHAGFITITTKPGDEINV